MATGNKEKLYRIIFYTAWLVISLIQAYNSELLADEAYYWKYAQNLSWGYFDHPPVVAVMIKSGYSLLHNELGVRLAHVLISIGFLYLLEKLVQPQKLLLYYLCVASIGLFHFIGVWALPDMPLLFFTASFFYLYRKYLERTSASIVLLLSLNIALLLLSKYHGILIIFFTIVAYPAILRRSSFWLITLLSIALFSPHIYWQLSNGMPSVKYHFVERSANTYSIEYTLNYLLSALGMFAPLTGIVLLWYSLKNKTTHVFDRTMKYNLAGILLFFLIMSFKGPTEANWVAYAIIPAVYLGYRKLEDVNWFTRFIRISFTISIILLLICRAYLIYDFLPVQKQFMYVKNKFGNTEAWAKDIEQYAGERPVVFMNSYQSAARYEFYTGNRSISLNNRMGRKNQYNLWIDEYELQGENVILIPNYHMPGLDSIQTPKGIVQFYPISNFRSASDIRLLYDIKEITVEPSQDMEVNFTIKSRDNLQWDYEASPEYPAVIHSLFFKHGERISDASTEFYIKNAMVNDDKIYTIWVTAPAEKGTYELYLDVASGWLPSSINGSKINVHVK